jgi:hypothetical protein
LFDTVDSTADPAEGNPRIELLRERIIYFEFTILNQNRALHALREALQGKDRVGPGIFDGLAPIMSPSEIPAEKEALISVVDELSRHAMANGQIALRLANAVFQPSEVLTNAIDRHSCLLKEIGEGLENTIANLRSSEIELEWMEGLGALCVEINEFSCSIDEYFLSLIVRDLRDGGVALGDGAGQLLKTIAAVKAWCREGDIPILRAMDEVKVDLEGLLADGDSSVPGGNEVNPPRNFLHEAIQYAQPIIVRQNRILHSLRDALRETDIVDLDVFEELTPIKSTSEIPGDRKSLLSMFDDLSRHAIVHGRIVIALATEVQSVDTMLSSETRNHRLWIHQIQTRISEAMPKIKEETKLDIEFRDKLRYLFGQVGSFSASIYIHYLPVLLKALRRRGVDLGEELGQIIGETAEASSNSLAEQQDALKVWSSQEVPFGEEVLDSVPSTATISGSVDWLFLQMGNNVTDRSGVDVSSGLMKIQTPRHKRPVKERQQDPDSYSNLFGQILQYWGNRFRGRPLSMLALTLPDEGEGTVIMSRIQNIGGHDAGDRLAGGAKFMRIPSSQAAVGATFNAGKKHLKFASENALKLSDDTNESVDIPGPKVPEEILDHAITLLESLPCAGVDFVQDFDFRIVHALLTMPNPPDILKNVVFVANLHESLRENFNEIASQEERHEKLHALNGQVLRVVAFAA